jgi:hypothetical protein
MMYDSVMIRIVAAAVVVAVAVVVVEWSMQKWRYHSKAAAHHY